jgi:hypothetical protein
MTVLKHILHDRRDGAQEQDHPNETSEWHDPRPLLRRTVDRFKDTVHRSESDHVEGIQLLNEAAKTISMIGSDVDNHETDNE